MMCGYARSGKHRNDDVIKLCVLFAVFKPWSRLCVSRDDAVCRRLWLAASAQIVANAHALAVPADSANQVLVSAPVAASRHTSLAGSQGCA